METNLASRQSIYLAAALVLLPTASRPVDEPIASPYQSILERNIFGLKPAPPAPVPEAEKPPPVRITLTGITTILGDKRVLLKTSAASRPGEAPEPERSCVLTIGQRDGVIEVLDIDEKSGNVTLRNAGIVITLNIDRDGPKPSGPSDVPALPLPPAAFPHPAWAVLPRRG